MIKTIEKIKDACHQCPKFTPAIKGVSTGRIAIKSLKWNASIRHSATTLNGICLEG